MNKSILIFLILPALFLTSCKEQGDVAAANNAQACFDKADETDQSAVLECLDYIEGVSTAEAETVRCSILLTAGGVTSDRMATAIAAQDTAGDSGMMTYFAFTEYSSGSENKSKVKEAKEACKNSGVSGLVGLSSFASTGTLLCKGQTTCTNGSNAAVDTLIDQCATPSGTDPDTDCTAEDKEEIGDTALLMNEVYCNGGESDAEECQALADAISALNPEDQDDPVAVADAILAEWKSQ